VYLFDQLDFSVIFFWVVIDRLPPETQKQLKKMSTTRLVLKLGKAGFNPDRLEQLRRADLLEAMAETMLAEPTAESETDFFREAREASQVRFPSKDFSGITSDGGSAAVRLWELELKEKRAEREEKKTAREPEVQRLVLKAVERKKNMAFEEKKLEAEEKRRELKVTVAREQAERDARLKAEQVRLNHDIRLVKLKPS